MYPNSSSSQLSPQQQDYQVFLELILGYHFQHISNVEFSKQDDVISFSVAKDKLDTIKVHFDSILVNPEALAAQLSYTATLSNANPVIVNQDAGEQNNADECRQLPVSLDQTPAAYLTVMQRLFGESILLGNQEPYVNLAAIFRCGGKVENGVLYSKELSGNLANIVGFKQLQGILLASFNDVSVEHARRAIHGAGLPH